MRRLSLILAGVSVLAGLSDVAATAEDGVPPPVEVTTEHAVPGVQTVRDTFNGRVAAVKHVAIVPRVNGFLVERRFEEGQEVAQGQLLYRIESAPYEAAVAQAQGSVDLANAQFLNAKITADRAKALENTPAGQKSVLDDRLANQQAGAAQLAAARAQLRAAQINLDYT